MLNPTTGPTLASLHPSVLSPTTVQRRGALAILVIFAGLLGSGSREAVGAPPAASATAGSRESALASASPRIVEKLRETLESDGARLGAQILDLESSRSVAASGEHLAMNPASNAKLATAAAALEVLGAEHRFVTGLYGDLKGTKVERLVLRSQGDPTLTTGDLGDLARELKSAGATEIGALLVDQSYFDERYVPPAFEQQPEEWAAFRAPVAAVSLERNTVTFWVHPAASEGDAATVGVTPPGFVDVTAKVETGKKGSAEKVALTLAGSGDRLRADLRGSIAQASRKAAYTRRVDDPRKLAGYALASILREQGIRAPSEVALGGKDEKTALALHQSAPVGELLHLLGKDSDNFTAEMLFRAIGAEAQKDPTPEAAVKTIEGFLKGQRAFEDGERIVNGSGLFEANRATAHSVATLLASAASDPRFAPEMVAHLAIGGVDGTLRSRLRPLRQGRAVRAKTGTLAKAVALSGYILGKDGRPRVAFSFLVETPPGKTRPARDAIDDAVVALARALD